MTKIVVKGRDDAVFGFDLSQFREFSVEKDFDYLDYVDEKGEKKFKRNYTEFYRLTLIPFDDRSDIDGSTHYRGKTITITKDDLEKVSERWLLI